jgi:hypothetical protein
LTHAVAALLLSFAPQGPVAATRSAPEGRTGAAAVHPAASDAATIAPPGLRPLLAEAGPRRGGGEPLRARGLAPDVSPQTPLPFVLVVGASDAPRARHDAWLAALAAQGNAAFLLEVPAAFDAFRRASAVADALAQLRAIAAIEQHELHRVFDPRRGALVAEGDGAAAAVRAAAEDRMLAALLLLDPAAEGTALPWLRHISAPTALVASGAPHASTIQAWHLASRGEKVRRHRIEFAGDQALPRLGADGPAAEVAGLPTLERDVRQLIVDFVECALPPPAPAVPGLFAERARRGTIDRRVESTDDAASVPLARRAD